MSIAHDRKTTRILSRTHRWFGLSSGGVVLVWLFESIRLMDSTLQ